MEYKDYREIAKTLNEEECKIETTYISMETFNKYRKKLQNMHRRAQEAESESKYWLDSFFKLRENYSDIYEKNKELEKENENLKMELNNMNFIQLFKKYFMGYKNGI